MHVDLERDCLCSPDVVFSWLAEPEKAKAWMKGISETKIIKNTPDRIGLEQHSGRLWKKTVEALR